MSFLNKLTINQKLTAIIMLISGIVLISSFAAFIVTDLILLRREMIKNVSTSGDIIGSNSTAALVFNDQKAAGEILQALSADPNIVMASIFTKEGQLFTSYFKDNTKESHADPYKDPHGKKAAALKDGHYFHKGHLDLYKRIVLDKETIGSVYIRYSLEELYSRIGLYTGIGVIILLASMLLAYILSSVLQHIISRPILSLAGTMERISAEKNYSLRAEKKSSDELGTLIDGFNEMLSLIQVRDEELERHSSNLEKLVEIRTSQLLKTNKELEETVIELQQTKKAAEQAHKMEAIGALAGGVAHDLNNILSGLVGYPQLILMELPDDSPMRKPILTMQRSGEKAAAIVQDLLTLARRGVYVKEVVNLNDIVHEYLQSHEYTTLRSYHPGVHVETNLNANLLNIMGSPVHLSKTLMNLITNAAEAMPDGGDISITLDNLYIQEQAQENAALKEGDYVALTVTDSGIGISNEDKERIFEPFYTKKVMGRSGTGLGMSVVLGTVQDHQGYIEVHSKVNGGTRFVLLFPATRQESTTVQSDMPIERYMGTGESILVVDDVEEQRLTASAMLRKLGYKVITVSSGEEAIEYLKNTPMDLVLMDMIMDPGIDGLETYKRIIRFNPVQKAIIASGFTETESIREALSLGVGAYVKKPYLLKTIGIAVKKELHGS